MPPTFTTPLKYVSVFVPRLTWFCLLCHCLCRNGWGEPWSNYSWRDIKFRGIHPNQTYVPHSAPSLSHCLHGRVQPPPYTNACYHGTQQGSAYKLDSANVPLCMSLSSLRISFLRTINMSWVTALHTCMIWKSSMQKGREKVWYAHMMIRHF